MHAGALERAAVNAGAIKSTTDSEFTGERCGRNTYDAQRRSRGHCNKDFV
jgi:hypothetical protein